MNNIIEFQGQIKPELLCHDFSNDISKILNPLELDTINTLLEFQANQVAIVEEITSLIADGRIIF